MIVSASKTGIELYREKLYPIKTYNFYYLDFLDDDQLNQQKNETYNLQCKNNKITMMIKVIFDRITMHCSINK